MAAIVRPPKFFSDPVNAKLHFAIEMFKQLHPNIVVIVSRIIPSNYVEIMFGSRFVRLPMSALAELTVQDLCTQLELRTGLNTEPKEVALEKSNGQSSWTDDWIKKHEG